MPSAVILVTSVTSGLGFLLNSAIFYLVLSQGRKTYHYLFAAILAICAIWDLSIFLVMVRNNHVNEVEALGYAVIPCAAIPALIFHFTCSYLNQQRKAIIIGLWIFTIVTIIGSLTGLTGGFDGVYNYPWGHIYRPDPTMRVANLIALPLWYILTLPACWLLYRAYQQEKDPLARRHLLYILVSLFAISMAIVKVVVTLGVEQGWYLTLGMFCNDVSAAIIGLAIIKDRLFDVTLVIRIGLIYSVLGGLAFFVFSLSEHLLTTFVAERVSGHSELIHIVALAVAIAALMPVKHRVEQMIDVYFADKKLKF